LLEVGACLLAISFLLLAISALNDLHELPLHLLHRSSESGQLTRDGRYILSSCHADRILGPTRFDLRAPLRVRGVARVQLHADLMMLARLAQALARARHVPLAA
jgi:hypothetical protein